MAIEFKGEEYLYLVKVSDSQNPFRIFNQTGGSTSSDADEVTLETKDKVGSDYGAVTQTISIEGVMTEGDEGLEYIKKSQRRKRFVEITEVNTRTKETEVGLYMLANVERSFAYGDYATYTISANLNGSITEGTLDEVPEGAPDSEADDGEEGAP